MGMQMEKQDKQMKEMAKVMQEQTKMQRDIAMRRVEATSIECKNDTEASDKGAGEPSKTRSCKIDTTQHYPFFLKQSWLEAYTLCISLMCWVISMKITNFCTYEWVFFCLGECMPLLLRIVNVVVKYYVVCAYINLGSSRTCYLSQMCTLPVYYQMWFK